MKIGTAIFFVAVGIWVTYTYPEIAQTAYGYIQMAIDWTVAMINNLKG